MFTLNAFCLALNSKRKLNSIPVGESPIQIHAGEKKANSRRGSKSTFSDFTSPAAPAPHSPSSAGRSSCFRTGCDRSLRSCGHRTPLPRPAVCTLGGSSQQAGGAGPRAPGPSPDQPGRAFPEPGHHWLGKGLKMLHVSDGVRTDERRDSFSSGRPQAGIPHLGQRQESHRRIAPGLAK